MPEIWHEIGAMLPILLIGAVGLSSGLWATIGLARLLHGRLIPSRPVAKPGIKTSQVAVIIAARNEEIALPKCITALKRIVRPGQIYVASDGSSDRTVAIARRARCRVLDIQPNGGKARALARGIAQFELCEKYKAILIQDADSEIDAAYLTAALPLFDNPQVACVAGHVDSRWDSAQWYRPSLVFAAYRTRLYALLQAVFRYGQSWEPVNVNYIAPGFASIYRSSVLREIDIERPGLVIEDFNMTFEVHRKRLGIVAYTPGARCSTEDPHRLGDYVKQVQRWYLGLCQTMRVHGFWASGFSLALLLLTLEMIFISLFYLALPVVALLHVTMGTDMPGLSAWNGVVSVNPVALLVLLLAGDYLLTCVLAAILRRPSLLLHGLAFPFLRLLDNGLFLQALVRANRVSDGRWTSPTRITSQLTVPGEATR